MKEGFVYIMTNRHNTAFYKGVTSDIEQRVSDHKAGKGSKHTSKYNCTKLVHVEIIPDIVSAIEREKQLKNWHRQWKLNLIKESNPHFDDFAKEWFDDFKDENLNTTSGDSETSSE